MKRLIVSLFVLTAVSFATVTVDGYALLENQTDHSGVTITFERTAPSALTETATTNASGYFTAELETGIYDVTYTKDGYFYQYLTDQSLYANTILSSLTLIFSNDLASKFSISSYLIISFFSILLHPETRIFPINKSPMICLCFIIDRI